MSDPQPRFDFEGADPREMRDAEARRLAVDPTRNVALEASAGTGKTRVLVDRYIGLLFAGVKPRNILAITFTRKAAAEMRQRILEQLARRHREGAITPELWREIRETLGEIAISTIDAFCLTLLREFPLEADVDPGFDLADETETPRLVDEALERTLRIGRGLAVDEAEMALLFAELGEYRLRVGLARLIDRRLVTWEALSRFLRHAHHATIDASVARLIAGIRSAFSSVPGGTATFVGTGPIHHDFALMTRDLHRLLAEPAPSPALTQALLERVRDHVLTQDGEPRRRLLYKKADFRSPRDYERHLAMVTAIGPYLVDALHKYREDINLVLARAVRRLFAVALEQYQRTLRTHGVLDFSDVLHRTLGLLARMDEFSRSRFKLESRYQHVLVDEFQDTSRAQWELVELLIRSWASGRGPGSRELEPSIFIVGDRKQSIYGFRDAEVSVLDEASRYIDALRPVGQVRTAISHSFRSVAELLSFVNDVFTAIEKAPDRADAFRYADTDMFPVTSTPASGTGALGIVAATSDEEQASAVADEIAALLSSGALVRDRDTGVRRAIRAGDIALLFRTRDGHQVFERALAARRVPYYVYKGLGFFDADEIKDILALLAFLARPQSELNAAAFLRSGVVRLSDAALKRLAPRLSGALVDPDPPACLAELSPYDQQRVSLARAHVPRWLALVDRLPPSELLDGVLADAAYAAQTRGPAYRQARENLKKVRALVRRLQNRGYATLGRIVDHFEQLVAGGDESNAIVDAIDAVNLMTTHAAKGLEFPVVFLVHMHRGSGGSPDAMRVVPAPFGREDRIEPSVAIGEHESDADRDLAAREAEEAKRLLYVALTRARDRVYLAATLSANGRFSPGAGGLGRMLPPALAATFVAAAASDAVVAWAGASRVHEFRVVRSVPVPMTVLPVASEATPGVDHFTALEASGPRRVGVTDIAGDVSSAADAAWGERQEAADASTSTRALGSFVHRALQSGMLALDGEDRLVALDRLLAPDERAALDDVPAFLHGTAATLERLRAHPVVAELFLSPASPVAWRCHEVPVSVMRADGVIVRGIVDCVVGRVRGAVEVIEFKTGRPQAAHEAQLDLYLDAVRALFPGVPVEGRLVYPG